jgi:hypothetical protein
MRVDQQRRALSGVRQIEAAWHLPMRTRQSEVALPRKRDRPLAEKCSETIGCGADLA